MSQYRFGDQLFTGATAPRQVTPNLPSVPQIANFQAAQSIGGNGVSNIFDPHHYLRLNGEQVFILPASESILILPRSATLRNAIMLRNSSGAADVYVSFGNSASVNSILKLSAGDQVLYDVGVPQDDVFAFSTVLGATIIIASSTTPGRSI